MTKRTRKKRRRNILLALVSVLCLAVIAGYILRMIQSQQHTSDDQQDERLPQTTRPELMVVPIPNLDDLNQAVQQQIHDYQKRLTTQQNRPDATRKELSAAFGEMGKLYHAYDMLDAAEACYRNAEKLIPDDFRWPYYLGNCYDAQSKPSEAIAAFQRTIAIRSDSVPAQVALAQTYLEANQTEQAQSWFQRALAIDSSCARAMVGLGKICNSRRDFTAAVQHFESALKLQPEATVIYYPLAMAYRGLGDINKARVHIEKRGNTKTAFSDPLMAELDTLPIGAEHFVLSGVAAGKSGKLKFALQELQKAVQEDPQNALARLNLGTALTKLGNKEAAIEQFRQAIRLKPDFSMAHCNLGVLLAERGSRDKAMEHFRQAIHFDPQYLNAHLGLANSLVQIKDHKQAAEHYARMIEIDPSHRGAWLGQAVALTRSGQYDEARVSLEEARIILPESMILAHALARLLAACPDPAVRDGQRALQLAQAVFNTKLSIDHAETMAMAYAEMKQFKIAIDWQNQAIAVAQKIRRDDLLPRLNENLTLYQRRQPCRIPWPGNTVY
jgi:tetratricopeptide (TPR) repeat protein